MDVDPLLGTPYAAVRFVARGASGEVWQARHRTLGKKVAVKLLHGWHLEDLRQADRLRLEAQALARLRSPHLVAVHDLGTTREGRPYFVMDYLEGRTLDREIAARGCLPAWEACRVVGQLLEALRAVHAAGLVHRDVKPGNLFYCTGVPRQLKLLDLGIAKLRYDSTGARRLGIAPLAVPTDGSFPIGTPRYLAPEQIDGRQVDPRCDLYAAGLVLYKLLAGRGPFDHRQGIAEIFVAQVSEQPAPPSAYAAAALDAALDAVAMKAIAKRPEDRFPCAGAFAEALEAVAPRPSAVEEAPTLRIDPDAAPTAPLGRKRPTPGVDDEARSEPHRPVRLASLEATLAGSAPAPSRSARGEWAVSPPPDGNLRVAEPVRDPRAATLRSIYGLEATVSMSRIEPHDEGAREQRTERMEVARAPTVAVPRAAAPAMASGEAVATPTTRRAALVGERRGRRVLRMVALAGSVAAAVASLVLASLVRC